MKKTKTLLISALVAVAALCMGVAFAACGKSDKGGSSASVYGAGEEGWYYYDATDSSEYLMSLQGGMYMISDGGDA
ncbi:MAG: hypothetical protein LUD72_01510, partial [Bacteroidales bacterium]|nr:hypothetical protein [Bacteroidales bacterium]